MITKFATWLWDQFSPQWHSDDTNKDVNGQGTAERLICVMGLELDDEVVAKIDDYLDILDVQITPEKFIDHISDVLGNPPNMFNDTTQYRNILSYIVSVYKVKGTVAGYEAFFNLLGFDITITETPNPSGNYDDGNVYDEPDILNIQFYDTNHCEPCAKYEIVFTSQFPDTLSPDDLVPDALDKLAEAVTFVEPINATLIFTQYLIPIVDSFGADVDEFIEVFTIVPENYDKVGTEYDEGRNYDAVDQDLVYSFGLHEIGYIINDDFNSASLGDYTELNTDGTVAYNIDAGYLKITGTPLSASPIDNILIHDVNISEETWVFETQFTIKTKVSSNEGFAFGFEPDSTVVGGKRLLFYKFRNTGHGLDGDVEYSYNDAAHSSFITSSVPSSIGDEIYVKIEKTWGSFIVTTINLTNPETLTDTKTYDLSDFVDELFTTTGHLFIGTGGGDHWVKYIKLYSSEMRNIVDGALLVGDGNFQGYEHSSRVDTVIGLLEVSNPTDTFTLRGGHGDKITTHTSITGVNMFTLHNPKTVILWIGSNEIIADGVGTAQAIYGTLIAGYVNAGATKFIHIEALPRAGNTGINTWNTWLDTTYNSGIHSLVEINATFNDGGDFLDSFYSSDGIHLNSIGSAIVEPLITVQL